MEAAELVLALLIAVAALVTIARRLGIAYPIFLVIGGLVLGLIPGLPRIEIEPDVIFLLVLPPLLDQLRETYRHRSEHVERQRDPASPDGEDRELIEHREIRRTVIDAEREALLRLRADGAIDENVLRELERELDLEERRMDA